MARYQVQAIEFLDSLGQTFKFQITTNVYAGAQKQLEQMSGTMRLQKTFHLGLVNGSDEQKSLTLNDAGEILDDIGMVKANELIDGTKFGKNLAEALANAAEKAKSLDTSGD